MDVTMTEFRFDYGNPLPSGRVVFRVHNSGRLTHRLTMVPVAEDTPRIDEQLRDGKRQSTLAFAGVPDQQPGDVSSFAVDLRHGVRYALLCFVVDNGTPHALNGMSSEFRAGGPKAPPPPAATPEEEADSQSE